MILEKLEVKPMTFSTEPEFIIDAVFSYENDCRVPIKCAGYIYLDQLRVATLNEYTPGNVNDISFSSRNANNNAKRIYKTAFVAPISRFVLSKFEEKRNMDVKRDLKFNVVLNITVLETMFDTVPVKPEAPSIHHNPSLIGAVSAVHDAIFKYRPYNYQQEYRIPSADWIHDFVPVFQNSKFHVFELPIPQITKKKGDFGKRINLAINSIKEMETAKNNGDWSELVGKSRPVWELIKHRAEIIELLKNDGLSEPATSNYNVLIQALFDFSSKFVHKESKTKELMSNKADKEDAELIYTLSVSLLNLISRKMEKFSK